MKCIVKNCLNNPTKLKPGVSFHRLPKCQMQRNIWLENLGWKQKIHPSKFSVVCSDHFHASSFSYGNNTSKNSRLNKNAVPLYIIEKKRFDGEEPFQYANYQPQKDFRYTREKFSSTAVNNQITSGSVNQLMVNKTPTKISTKPKSSAPTPVATKTLNKTLPNCILNPNGMLLPTNASEKLTEQILIQLSNLDKKNLKSIINNSNAKFESALQVQARKKFRSELRKKLRNFNLNRDQSENNFTLNRLIDSGRIPSDVLKKIEDVFNLDIFQGSESHEETSEVIEESEGDDDNGSASGDLLSDTYMLLVKYGLIPSILPNPEQIEKIGDMDENHHDLSETTSTVDVNQDPLVPIGHETIINVDDLPTVPRVYEDSTNNITNDDVILIEPRSEIITIGSPEHESPDDESLTSENFQQLNSELDQHFPNNDSQDETEQTIKVVETEEIGGLNTNLLFENGANYLSSSVLTIIQEYNANLQKCYRDKKEIDLRIASLQSQKDSLEINIAQIQANQTKFLELFLQKSNFTMMAETKNSSAEPSSELRQRKRKLSTNSSISSREHEKQPRCEILETNGNSIDSTVINISNSEQPASKNFQQRNFQNHTRTHSSDVKDITKTNDYVLVSAGAEILRYSCNKLELEKVYKRHRALVTGVFVLNNEYVFSVSLDMNLHKFSLEGFQNPLSTHCFKESLTALEYGWNILFIGSARGRIIAFNIETNKICLDFHSDVKNSINTLKTIEVSNKKYLTVLTTKSLNLYICDAVSGIIIKTIDTFNYINDIAIDNDSIYCGLNSNELLTFNVFSGRSHDPKELDTKSTIKCVKTYKNLVLVGCSDGYIHIYHKSTNLYLDLIRITDKGLICFEIYPRKIIFSSGDKSLTVNDMPQEIAIYLE